MPHTFCQSCESCRNCGADPLVRAGPPGPAFRQRNRHHPHCGEPTGASAADRGSAPQSMQTVRYWEKLAALALCHLLLGGGLLRGRRGRFLGRSCRRGGRRTVALDRRADQLHRRARLIVAVPGDVCDLVDHVLSVSHLAEDGVLAVSYTHLRAHETVLDLVC